MCTVRIPSVHLYEDSVKQALLLCPFYTGEDKELEKLDNLPKVTHIVGRARI